MLKDESRTDLNEFIDTSERMSDLISEFFDVLGTPWMQQAMQVYWSHAYDIDGVPLRVTEFEDGSVVDEFRMRSVRSETFAPEVFAIPKDFQRRAILDFTAPPRAVSEED
jgi:hypothetical protein